MCGIAGYTGGTPPAPQTIDACLTMMRHRGPDAQAWTRRTHADGRAVDLLHTRLAIIDLDPRANQPFRVGSRSMIYNGEIYNFIELRNALEGEGVTFQTTSDTEVLLRAIDRWGWDALDRFEGMWALAVHDEADGSLTFSRDRFGEKPLYLFRDGADLYFGSEIKFIVALLGHRLEVDEQHLYRYLVNGYRALHKSHDEFFLGVTTVAPGTVSRLSAAGEWCVRRFWTPATAIADAMSYDEAVDGVRSRLLEAVRIRLRADVPLAFCMSGGVDSNSLISIARRVFDYDVHGFTIQNADARYDERELVADAVQDLGIRHTAVQVTTTNFLSKLRAVVRQHDAPVSTISYYAHWLLMEQIAACGYRIAVSGTAADEVFSGYYDHHLAYLADTQNQPEIYGPAVAAWRTHVQPIVRNPFLRDPDAFVRNPALRDHIFLDAREFAGYLQRDWSEPFAETEYSASMLRNRMLNELFHEVVPVILHEDDLNAMSFSIENRSPFLDRGLFEFASSIPTQYLIRDGYAKAILRDAMRGIVPPAVLESRRKVGFNAPIHAFIDPSDRDTRASLLDDSPVFDHVRRDRIEALLDKPALPNSESKFLFYFLNAKMFLEEFGA